MSFLLSFLRIVYSPNFGTIFQRIQNCYLLENRTNLDGVKQIQSPTQSVCLLESTVAQSASGYICTGCQGFNSQQGCSENYRSPPHFGTALGPFQPPTDAVGTFSQGKCSWNAKLTLPSVPRSRMYLPPIFYTSRCRGAQVQVQFHL